MVQSYKDDLAFSALSDGATSPEAGTVEFSTGAFVTGRDWWLVTFSLADGSTYMTDGTAAAAATPACTKAPQPAHGHGHEAVGRPAGAAMPGVGPGPRPGHDQVAAAAMNSEPGAAATAACRADADALVRMLHSRRTDGFLQHSLAEQDLLTTIELQTDGVTWRSPSGHTTAGVVRVAGPPAPLVR